MRTNTKNDACMREVFSSVPGKVQGQRGASSKVRVINQWSRVSWGILASVLLANPAAAASISWGPAFELVSISDLDLSAPYIQAVNGGNDAGVTVGGVTFDSYAGPNFGTVTEEPSWITTEVSGGDLASFGTSGLDVYATTTGDADLDTILATHTYTLPNLSLTTHTLRGLTIGETYQVQIVGQADDRGVCCDDYVTKVDGGDGMGGVTLHRFIDLNGDSVKHVSMAIGTFIADATIQEFTTIGQSSDGTPTGANEGHGGFAALIVSSDQPFGAAEVAATIDRATGGLTLTNNATVGTANIIGYSLSSAAGGFDQSGWKSITANYDANGPNTANGGALIGTVDADDNWTILTAANDHTDLSEAELDGGNGGTIAPGQTVDLGAPWRRTPFEDVTAELLLDDGTIQTIPVSYTGASIVSGDLDGNGTIDQFDWAAFKSGQGTNFANMSPAASYQLGNLLMDNVHDLRDFALFEEAFDLANGPGALAALVASVPEPSSYVLLLALAGVWCGIRRFRTATGPLVALIAVAVGLCVSSGAATAASISWGPAFELASVADLDLTGGNILATNGGNNAGVVVGGVTFDNYTSPAFQAITGEPAWITSAVAEGELRSFAQGDFDTYTTTTGNASLDTILASHTYNIGPLAEVTYTLSGLIVGQTYQVQIVGQADDRDFYQDFITNVDGGDSGGGVTLHRFVDLNGDSVKHVSSAIGTFTADATTQTFITNGQTLDGSPTAPEPDWRGHGGFSALILSEVDSGGVFRLGLEVNTTTGNILLRNDTAGAIELDSYQILSAGESPSFIGSLNPGGWSSIAERTTPVAGFPQGSGSGDGWEVGPNVSDNELIEWYLDDEGNESSLASGAAINLGSAYNTSVDGQDLQFLYRQTNGSIISGIVDYVTSAPVDGDYNGNGLVDLADYTIWRDTLGSTTDLRADGSGNNNVGPEDYLFWKQRFGNSAGSGSVAAAAVPEPAAAAMALVCLAAACVVSRRRNGVLLFATSPGRAVLLAASAVGVAWAAEGSTAQAAVTNDREYTFGEDGLEGASQGAIIGSGNTSPLAFGDTADSKGPSMAFLDLTQSGDPTYQNVGTGPNGLARPGVIGTEYGARFDGVDDRLTGIPLNRPDELELLVLAERGTFYPIEYAGITSRGAQMWVYPDASQLGVAPQTILFDTQVMGGPQITADGKWTQANSQHTADDFNGFGAVPGDVSVVGDTWHHVMHHVYNRDDPDAPSLVSGGGGTNHVAVVYVNGVAVSANGDNLPAGFDLLAQGFSGDLIVGAEDDGNGGFKNHFKGVIDNLEMYVFGNNEMGSPGNLADGEDWGTFDLFEDNEWIKTQIINTVPGGVLNDGDVNKDGEIDQADVSAFVAGWKSRKVMLGAHSTLTVGDWNTWGNGDMNHDGVTDLADAFILHQALISATGNGLDFGLLSGEAVPEPTTLAVLVLAVVPTMLMRGLR